MVAALILPLGACLAAQTYVTPQLNLRLENNDNFDMTPAGVPKSDVYGYIADLQALIGIATPRGETSIRPRLRFQEYPDRPDRRRLEGFLDLRSKYRWERSNLLVVARYDRQDYYNTVLPGAGYDPLYPNDPSVPDTAVARRFGDTRDQFKFAPRYSFDTSERTTVGVEAQYTNVAYHTTAPVQTQTDYQYAQGRGFVSWALDPRSDVSVGGYVSKYEARDGSSAADSYGADIGYARRWSEAAGIELTMYYETSDSTDFVPVRTEETTSGWGGEFSAYWKGPVSRWRMRARRSFVPSSYGGLQTADEFRVQYQRNLSTRLAFDGAARYVMERGLTSGNQRNDKDYARLDLSMRWMMTPTVYVEGGYNYIWQQYQSNNSSAANNILFVSVGYQGLGRPWR